MKYRQLSFIIITLTILGILLSTHQNIYASSRYMDDKLVINGFIKETAYIRTAMQDREEMYHDNDIDFLQTSALLELLYKVKNDEDLSINLFVGFKYWWQKAQYFDQDYRRSIPHHERKDWAHPRSFQDDVLTETYIDVSTGPWKIRLGKQIVIWGQLDLERVADVVNPIDIRRGPPGVNTWEEVKQGLWMIRLFYQSELPGNLLFEAIFNPGDYQNFETPYEGAQQGVKAANTRFFDRDKQKFGIYSWNREKWTRDAPGFNLSNYEFGFRVRGNTFEIDWTLLYWNARDDGPVANPDKINDFTTPFIMSGLLTAMTGNWVEPPDWSEFEKVYYFKRYQTIGGTAQYYNHKLWDTVWRFEWFYEIGRPLNKGTNGDSAAIYDWTRRNILGMAIQCNKKWKIPWFTKNVVNNLMLESSITYGWEKVMNHNHDLVLSDRNYYWKNSSNDVVTVFLMQGLCDMSFVFVFTGNYFLKVNKWQAIPVLSYVFPGNGLRGDIGYVAYGGANKEWVHTTGSVSSHDLLFLRLRYEF